MIFSPADSAAKSFWQRLHLPKNIIKISILSVLYVFPVQAEVQRFDLLLAGGGLKTCSSMAEKNCTNKPDDSQGKAQLFYRLDEEGLDRWKKSFPAQQKDYAKFMNKILMKSDIYSGEALSRRGLRRHFADRDLLDWYRELPDPLFYALLDALEIPQQDAQGKRLQEQVMLENTANQASVAIYRTFVKQAALRMKEEVGRPRIAVITASSRDPFEVADFYIDVFTQAGADTIWLPLDKTYQQARALESLGLPGCEQLSVLRAKNQSYYRERIYPQRIEWQQKMCESPQMLIDQLAQVQGVFFNGGDQSLTLAALTTPQGHPSEALQTITRRMHEGELIVGGTSAGTAVQAGRANALSGQPYPVPMITNGHSAKAMLRGAMATPPPSQRCDAGALCDDGLQADDLTYRAQGGSGLFALGLLDTHFSERDRETRLAVFAQATQQRLAFGVDEATALLVGNSESQYAFSVIGQGGVFIVDRHVSRQEDTQGMVGAGIYRRQLSAISHYLSAGDTATFETATGNWQFTLAGKPLHKRLRLKPLKAGLWRDKLRAQCGSHDAISWAQFGNLYALKASEHTQFAHVESTDHCSYVHLPFAIEKTSK